MRWQGRERSRNIEDRRHMSGRGVAVGGGLGTLLLVLVLSLVFGVDPGQLLQPVPNGGMGGGPGALPGGATDGPAVDDEVKQFVSVVLRDTEVVWDELFRERGDTYQPPHLVMFTGRVSSGCGLASSGMGPFYCP